MLLQNWLNLNFETTKNSRNYSIAPKIPKNRYDGVKTMIKNKLLWRSTFYKETREWGV